MKKNIGGSLSFSQFLVFTVVGALGTLVHYAILFLLINFNQPVMMSTITGSIGGAVVNFILNHRVTFLSKQPYHQTAPRFFLLVFLILLMNAGIMYVLTMHFYINYLLAQLLTTAIILCFNYASNALWTFNHSSNK